MHERGVEPDGEPLDGAETGARAARALRGARDPVVWILLLAAFFDGLSDNSIHAAFLAAIALVLWWDGVRPPVSRAARYSLRVETVPRVVLLAGALAYAEIVGGFARYSLPMTIAVLVPGAVLVVLSWGPSRTTDPGASEVDLRSSVPWILVFVTLGLWELIQLLLQPSFRTDSYDHPTLSALSDRYLAWHLARSIGLFVWLLIGWFLIRRRPSEER